jgi:O-antigen ligase
MLIELKTGLALRQSLGVRAWPFIFNRPALTVTVTAIPAVVWLAYRKGADSRLLALFLGAVASVLIALSWSGAAALGLGVIWATALLARFLPRLAVYGTGLALVAAFALAPVQGAIGEKLIPPKVHSELSASHSRERLDVWLTFGGAIQAAPIAGAGFGASARMQDTSAAEALPPLRRVFLEVGHPHDAAMQVWAELGVVGVALAVAVLLLALRGLAALPKARLVPALALMTGTAIVALVGHGAWQGWWAASIGAAIVWLRAIDHSTQESP